MENQSHGKVILQNRVYTLRDFNEYKDGIKKARKSIRNHIEKHPEKLFLPENISGELWSLARELTRIQSEPLSFVLHPNNKVFREKIPEPVKFYGKLEERTSLRDMIEGNTNVSAKKYGDVHPAWRTLINMLNLKYISKTSNPENLIGALKGICFDWSNPAHKDFLMVGSYLTYFFGNPDLFYPIFIERTKNLPSFWKVYYEAQKHQRKNDEVPAELLTALKREISNNNNSQGIRKLSLFYFLAWNKNISGTKAACILEAKKDMLNPDIKYQGSGELPINAIKCLTDQDFIDKILEEFRLMTTSKGQKKFGKLLESIFSCKKQPNEFAQQLSLIKEKQLRLLITGPNEQSRSNGAEMIAAYRNNSIERWETKDSIEKHINENKIYQNIIYCPNLDWNHYTKELLDELAQVFTIQYKMRCRNGAIGSAKSIESIKSNDLLTVLTGERREHSIGQTQRESSRQKQKTKPHFKITVKDRFTINGKNVVPICFEVYDGKKSKTIENFITPITFTSDKENLIKKIGEKNKDRVCGLVSAPAQFFLLLIWCFLEKNNFEFTLDLINKYNSAIKSKEPKLMMRSPYEYWNRRFGKFNKTFSPITIGATQEGDEKKVKTLYYNYTPLSRPEYLIKISPDKFHDMVDKFI